MTLLGDKPQELIILVAGTDTQYLPTTSLFSSDLVTALLLSAYELTSVGCNLRGSICLSILTMSSPK